MSSFSYPTYTAISITELLKNRGLSAALVIVKDDKADKAYIFKVSNTPPKAYNKDEIFADTPSGDVFVCALCPISSKIYAIADDNVDDNDDDDDNDNDDVDDNVDDKEFTITFNPESKMVNTHCPYTLPCVNDVEVWNGRCVMQNDEKIGNVVCIVDESGRVLDGPFCPMDERSPMSVDVQSVEKSYFRFDELIKI